MSTGLEVEPSDGSKDSKLYFQGLCYVKRRVRRSNLSKGSRLQWALSRSIEITIEYIDSAKDLRVVIDTIVAFIYSKKIYAIVGQYQSFKLLPLRNDRPLPVILARKERLVMRKPIHDLIFSRYERLPDLEGSAEIDPDFVKSCRFPNYGLLLVLVLFSGESFWHIRQGINCF